jgi:hypothetical protein
VPLSNHLKSLRVVKHYFDADLYLLSIPLPERVAELIAVLEDKIRFSPATSSLRLSPLRATAWTPSTQSHARSRPRVIQGLDPCVGSQPNYNIEFEFDMSVNKCRKTTGAR